MFFQTTRTAAAVSLALLAAGCGASPYYVSESKKAFLPMRGAPPRLGEVRLLPGETLFQSPVGYREAATLATPVTGNLLGKPFGFPAGALLTRNRVFGVAATAHVPPTATVLCGAAAARAPAGMVAGALLGSAVKGGGTRRVCLIDAQGDGTLEQAILVGAGKPEEAVPVAIAPAAYKALINEPMPGESVAKLTYAGKPGRVAGDSVGFRLSVVEDGHPLFFQNVRTAAKLNKLPQRLQVMSAAFTVKAYDPADGSVVVDVERGFQESEYGITTTTRTTYIPIYIPR